MFYRNFVTILKFIIVVTLLLVYYQFFFKDVIANYSEDMTNIATMLKAFNDDEIGIKAPAFTICMEPASKKEILEKYNITSAFFFLKEGSFEHLKGKKTMKEIIYETSYRLNKDFKIAFTSLNHFESANDSVYLNIGTNPFSSYEHEFFINVTEIYSILNGMCYIIQSNLYIATQYSYILSVILGNDNMTQKPNQMHLIATSDDDALWTAQGFEGDALRLTVPDIEFNNNTIKIDLEESIKTKLLNCNKNDNESYQKCLASGIYYMIKASNCPDKCTPMAIKSLHDKYFGEGENLCNSLGNEACLIRDMMKLTGNISLCDSEIQCHIKTYYGSGQILKQPPTKLYLDDGDRADLLLMATSRTRQVMKEYRIYDTAGMVGTVGGSLGLFLGFSFYGALSDILEFLVKKIARQEYKK